MKTVAKRLTVEDQEGVEGREFSFSDACGDELIDRAHNIHGNCKGMYYSKIP